MMLEYASDRRVRQEVSQISEGWGNVCLEHREDSHSGSTKLNMTERLHLRTLRFQGRIQLLIG